MDEVLQCLKSSGLDSDSAALCLRQAAAPLGLPQPGLHHPSVWAIVLAVLLVPCTGLFAGLTLGLLSLDLVSLRILEVGGDPKEREHARKIMPVRKKGNLLLCTLLLGNTVINSAISILLADLTSGAIGLIVSSFIILIFGEIIPQSICSRHGLQIGSHLIAVVTFFILVLAPIAWPISLLLDLTLERDIGNVYSQEELKHLISIHVYDPDAQAESGLTVADQRLLLGALEYKNKRVGEVMTSLEQVFMLEQHMRLTFATMLAIYKSGFTRIPVYAEHRESIVGILYAKDLILIDPDDEIEIAAVLSFRGRGMEYVDNYECLDKVFKTFISSQNHMLLVCNNAAVSPIVGLITLEDVLEELIQAEIVDESDIYEDVDRRVLRRGGTRADIASFLSMFQHKLAASAALSEAEMSAVAAFLPASIPEFAPLASSQLALKGLISHAEVLERVQQGGAPGLASHPSLGRTVSANSRRGSCEGPALPDERGIVPAASLPHEGPWQAEGGDKGGEGQMQLYRCGEPSDTFTLILQGRVLIRAGKEGFELELGPWTVLGLHALLDSSYVPDFDALAIPPFRLLRICRAAFAAACAACAPDPVIGYQSRVEGRRPRSACALSLPDIDGIESRSCPHPDQGARPSIVSYWAQHPQAPARCRPAGERPAVDEEVRETASQSRGVTTGRVGKLEASGSPGKGAVPRTTSASECFRHEGERDIETGHSRWLAGEGPQLRTIKKGSMASNVGTSMTWVDNSERSPLLTAR